jgi:hypothetical protein
LDVRAPSGNAYGSFGVARPKLLGVAFTN